MPWFTFLRGLAPTLLVTVATITLGHAAAWVWEIGGWADLILIGLGLSVLYCAGVYGLLLTQSERQLLRNMLRKEAA